MDLHFTGSIYSTYRPISDKAFPGKLTAHQAEASSNRQTPFFETETLGFRVLDPVGWSMTAHEDLAEGRLD